MWQRFTERARRVVFFAQEEAGRLGENYVSTEHLLLGLVRENDSVAARILDRMGVSLERIRSEIERQVTRGDGCLGQDMQLTPRAKRVIDLAYDEARQLSNNYIGTEHLLLGLIREGEGLAGRVLAKLGVDLERTRNEILRMQDNGAPAPLPTRIRITPELLEALQQLLEKLKTPEMQSAAQMQGVELEGDIARVEELLKATPAPPAAPSDTPAPKAAPPERPGAVSSMAERALEFLERKLQIRAGRNRPTAPPIEDEDILIAYTAIDSDAFELKGKSLLSIADLNREQIEGILTVTRGMETAHRKRAHMVRFEYPRCLALIFEKPSLRTRVTFDLGMQQMGGLTVVLGPAEIGLGTREAVPDAARNLERWVDAIMARVFHHEVLQQLRDNCRIPVINGLSDREHPCQVLADLYTIQQKKGMLEGLKLAWVGDGNNVLHSLLLGGALTGMVVEAACPEGYAPNAEIVAQAQALAGDETRIVIGTDPAAAVQNADVVYTDVWTSMGQEAEQEARRQVFQPYQVNAALMAAAKPDALFMHCLPAHRGEEVTDDVLDGPQSVVFEQAENRLYAQKAVLALLLGRD